MVKLKLIHIDIFLSGLLFQGHAQNTTTTNPMMNWTSVGTSFNMTTVDVNNTTSNTTLKGASVSYQSSAITLLIPVALAGSLLQGRF